jgi:hypothetical protein
MNYSYINNSDSNYNNYESFNPLPGDIEIKRNIEIETNIKRQNNILKIIEKYKLKKLNSDYFDMSSFYYDKLNRYIWQVQNIGKEFPFFYKPETEIYLHIKELNNIDLNIFTNIQPNNLEETEF